MTRDDEIYKRLQEIDSSNFNSLSEYKGYMNGYIDGSKWADRTMIERACRYFENIACCGWIEDIGVEEFINKFKHAMTDEQREKN